MSERIWRAQSELFYFNRCRGQSSAALALSPSVSRLVKDYWTV